MKKVIVSEFLTVDGVMQSPGDPDEDPSGGFQHGGWQQSFFDDTLGADVTDGITAAGGLILGRVTYEIFAGYWPTAPAEVETLAGAINRMPKYVASTTLTNPLEWENSTVLEGDVGEAVGKLKEDEGGDLLVIGSGQLVQTLMERGLVDRFHLMIHPLVLGGGKRLFRDSNPKSELRLVDSKPTTTGVVIARYEPVS